eukprot:6174546-Pleurochrysis_carterae.AAC.3
MHVHDVPHEELHSNLLPALKEERFVRSHTPYELHECALAVHGRSRRLKAADCGPMKGCNKG